MLRNLLDETYINDIMTRHRVRNQAELTDLLMVLASGIGGLTNPEKLSKTFQSVKQVNIMRKTVQKYIEYFEAAERVVSGFKIQDSGCRQVEFQILGNVEGPFQARLDELVKKGVVKHLGTTPDVRPYIGAVECTVMPSYHEGMSNVNLESAANGRPVITTDVPGCRETVDDGRTGYLVEARNADSLAAAMERFIALPYGQKVLMGQEGRRKVEREFDREIVVKAYLDEIEKINKNV